MLGRKPRAGGRQKPSGGGETSHSRPRRSAASCPPLYQVYSQERRREGRRSLQPHQRRQGNGERPAVGNDRGTAAAAGGGRRHKAARPAGGCPTSWRRRPRGPDSDGPDSDDRRGCASRLQSWLRSVAVPLPLSQLGLQARVVGRRAAAGRRGTCWRRPTTLPARSPHWTMRRGWPVPVPPMICSDPRCHRLDNGSRCLQNDSSREWIGPAGRNRGIFADAGARSRPSGRQALMSPGTQSQDTSS